MYNYYNPNQQPTQLSAQQQSYRIPQMQQVIGLKGRPVASVEEARAATIDFDGSIFFFPDLANKKIYTKQINIDGTMTLSIYEYKEVPMEAEINPNLFITREEFEKTITQLEEQLKVSPTQATPQSKSSNFEVKF